MILTFWPNLQLGKWGPNEDPKGFGLLSVMPVWDLPQVLFESFLEAPQDLGLSLTHAGLADLVLDLLCFRDLGRHLCPGVDP